MSSTLAAAKPAASATMWWREAGESGAGGVRPLEAGMPG
jgi:hypothetical protein